LNDLINENPLPLAEIEEEILSLLGRRGKRMSIVDIARQLRRSQTTVSKYVGLLQAKRRVKVDDSEPPRKYVKLSGKG
jgi:DNA-binding IclR family transcriptional regulator